MTTTTTGDLATISELEQAVKRHRGDTEAWKYLGGQLVARRTQLGYASGRRQRFVNERCRPADVDGLSYKFLYELEQGRAGQGSRSGRAGFPTGRLITVAEAYAVTLDSIGATLDGGSLTAVQAGLVAVPAGPDHQHSQPAGPPASVLMSSVYRSGLLTDAALAAAAPYATEILMRLRDLAVGGIVRPSGRQLFPDDDQQAAMWDRHADDMPDDDLAWLVAGQRVLEDSVRQQPDISAG